MPKEKADDPFPSVIAVKPMRTVRAVVPRTMKGLPGVPRPGLGSWLPAIRERVWDLNAHGEFEPPVPLPVPPVCKPLPSSFFQARPPSSFAAPVPSFPAVVFREVKSNGEDKPLIDFPSPPSTRRHMTARRKRGKKKYQRFPLHFLPPRVTRKIPASHRPTRR